MKNADGTVTTQVTGRTGRNPGGGSPYNTPYKVTGTGGPGGPKVRKNLNTVAPRDSADKVAR
jgi:hypothetical protein